MGAFTCPRCGNCWPADVLKPGGTVMKPAKVCPLDGCEVQFRATSQGLSLSQAKRKLFDAFYLGWDAKRKGPSPEELESQSFRDSLDEILGLPEAA